MVKELNLNLCQLFYWYNPSRLPYPSMYVCRRKIRAKDNVNLSHPSLLFMHKKCKTEILPISYENKF